MMPLFFASSHCNYAQYGLYYIQSMAAMPGDVRQHFINVEHTMHHNPGLFNGIWSDMAIGHGNRNGFYEVWPRAEWHHRNHFEVGNREDLGV